MPTLISILTFIAAFIFFLTIANLFNLEDRPRLQPLDKNIPESVIKVSKKKRSLIRTLLRNIAMINRPLCAGPLGKRMAKDLAVARVDLTPETLLLIKEIAIGVLLFMFYPKDNPDVIFFWFAICLAVGYIVPEYWIKSKIKKIKAAVIRELPDAIDLLALCVNAGLDFMLALKWVVEKSSKSVLVDELNLIMQEINVGKSRRVALKDFSSKYDLPDISTFTRTLIQADRMGTSVAEALNMLSEDMRVTRYRRGEQIALKAPLKMLIPLLLFIFPVVGILVGGPIFLDFIQNNPLKQIGGGLGVSSPRR